MTSLKQNWVFLFLTLLSLSTLAACGSGGGGTSSTTDLKGTIALNNGQAGTISLTVNTAIASNSWFSFLRRAEAQTGNNTTGNCITPTCNAPLGGNFNTTTNTFTVTGTGTGSNCPTGTLTFNGTYTPPTTSTGTGTMSGTITSTPPGGSPTPIGGFAGFNVTNSPGATNYCGDFNGGGRCVGGTNTDSECSVDTDCPGGGTCTKSDLGVFNVSINGAQLTGSAQSTCKNDNPTGLIATVSGSTFSGCSTDQKHPSPICGTFDGTNVTGFFKKERRCKNATNSDSTCTSDADCTGTGAFCGSESIGCFTGSTSGCSVNTPPTGCDSLPTACPGTPCAFQACP